MTQLPDFTMERAGGCPFDPAPALREHQQDRPMRRVRLWDGSTPWLVTGYAEQRALLAESRVSAEVATPGFPNVAETFGESGLSFVLMDDPEHNRLRRTVISQFTVKRVAAMRPRVQEIVDEQLDKMLAGPKPADLVAEFALPVPSLVICELLGVPYADHDLFQSNSRTILLQEATPEQRKAAAFAMAEYLGGLLGERFANPGEDMLSVLTGRITAGELTQDEAVEVAVLMLLAGHETTANMIALGTLALLQQPDQLALMRSDRRTVPMAVEELLRFLTISHSMGVRVAKEDFEVAGQPIAAGEGLIVPVAMGNWDDAVFKRPEQLDITREARGHLTFGFGPHVCLGQPLARMELDEVFSTLFDRFPGLRIDVPFEDVAFKFDAVFYGLHNLPVTWDPEAASEVAARRAKEVTS